MKKINFTGSPMIVASFLVIAVVLFIFGMNISEKKLESLSSVEFAENISSEKNIVLVDVRTPEEYDLGHLPGAVNMDYHSSEFERMMSEFSRDEKYAVYCRSGGRSAEVLSKMEEMGFKWVIDLSGGIESLAGNAKAVEYLNKD